MKKYETSKKRVWIPFVIIIGIAAVIIYIIYRDFYLVGTVILIPLFFLPSIMRSKRKDPDLVIIDYKLIKRGRPINKEYELSEYYEFKIEGKFSLTSKIYGYKLVDEIKKRDLLVRPIYQDSLETILKRMYSARLS